MVALSAVLLLMNGTYHYTLADHHGDKEKHRHGEFFDRDDDDDNHHGKEGRGRSEHLNAVNNPTYKEYCGACHFAYQPGLLPSGSWEKILVKIPDHFGEIVELDPESRNVISAYLKSNAAEYSSAERAVKIMRSLGEETPLRITHIPYIRNKHHDISPGILSRESIVSLSNCSACHRTADQGIYEDDDVEIPQ
jgi:hypothetical protein